MPGESGNAQGSPVCLGSEIVGGLCPLHSEPLYQSRHHNPRAHRTSSVPNASVVRVLQSLLIFATFIVALFASLRVYAIWSRDWRPALPVLLLALITPASNMYLDIIGTPIPAPRPSFGCAIQTNVAPELYSQSATRTDAGTSLVTLLLRDGTVYFLLLLILNIAQIILAALVPGDNFIAFFISPLTSILISRFLLNLREVAQGSEPVHAEASETAIMSTRFPSIHVSSDVLGNMGATLYSIFEAESAETAEGFYDEKVAEDAFLAVSVAEVQAIDVEFVEVF
ncbi:hypothetical protein OH77DRAFT_627554 [Trametes cingulata]|nr:hypothetical protein OH77DRAFT_627554 [Trametes cingulata]